jgi:recombination associated protein RdgC
MWFKNLVVYRLPADWSISAAELEEQLSTRPLQPCSPVESLSRGWVAPANNGRLVHTVNMQHLIALGVNQKLLPSSIIRQVTAERAEALAQEQGFPVGRRQMRDLKMRVTEELRARALTKRRITRAWIDPNNGWLVVDAAGAPRAEELIETLRDTLGSLAVQLLETEHSPQMSMALWVKLGDAPLRLTIDQDLELQAANKSKSSIRYTRLPLEGKEIQTHLSAGMYATRLGLTWSDRISFVLTDKLQIKRVEFLEMSKDSAGGEIDAAEQFDIDFTVMAGELAKLLDDVAAALGSEVQERQAPAARLTAGAANAAPPP